MIQIKKISHDILTILISEFELGKKKYFPRPSSKWRVNMRKRFLFELELTDSDFHSDLKRNRRKDQ